MPRRRTHRSEGRAVPRCALCRGAHTFGEGRGNRGVVSAARDCSGDVSSRATRRRRPTRRPPRLRFRRASGCLPFPPARTLFSAPRVLLPPLDAPPRLFVSHPDPQFSSTRTSSASPVATGAIPSSRRARRFPLVLSFDVVSPPPPATVPSVPRPSAFARGPTPPPPRRVAPRVARRVPPSLVSPRRTSPAPTPRLPSREWTSPAPTPASLARRSASATRCSASATRRSAFATRRSVSTGDPSSKPRGRRGYRARRRRRAGRPRPRDDPLIRDDPRPERQPRAGARRSRRRSRLRRTSRTTA